MNLARVSPSVFIAALMLLCLLAVCPAPPARADASATVYFHQQPVAAKAVVRAGAIYLPLETIRETFGVTVEADPDTLALAVNGQGAPEAAIRIGSRLFVPLDPVVRALGLRLFYNPDTGIVDLLKPAAPRPTSAPSTKPSPAPAGAASATPLVRCAICGKAVETTLLPDGRHICAACKAAGIWDQQTAVELYDVARNIIIKKYNLIVAPPAQFIIVDWQEMGRIERTPGSIADAEGFYVGSPEKIYVLSGLPRNRFIGVAGHEYIHSWQNRFANLRQDETLVEGFATWVQYHVLLELGDAQDAAALAARTDAYGTGLSFLLNMEQSGGAPAVLDYAEHHEDPEPPKP